MVAPVELARIILEGAGRGDRASACGPCVLSPLTRREAKALFSRFTARNSARTTLLNA
jgi:hypothetical protein